MQHTNIALVLTECEKYVSIYLHLKSVYYSIEAVFLILLLQSVFLSKIQIESRAEV